MNRVTFTICFVLLLSSQAFGLAPIGPASSGLAQGQFAIGTEYVKGDFKTEFKNYTIMFGDRGIQRLPGGNDVEFDLDVYFGKVSYGVSDECLVFANLCQDVWGFGTKITVRESATCDWGLTARIDFLSGGDAIYSPVVIAGNWSYAELQFDFHTVQIATGPVYKIDGLRLYGGPFIFLANGEGDFEGRYVYSDGMVEDIKSRWDIETEIELGGYVGVSLELFENLEVLAEYQITEDLGVFGAGLSFKF